MDIDLLKTFLEVSKTRHFGRAAESLYLTQSAVSFRIRQLESQLGVNLFSRHRNNIRLTHAGEQLISYAENMLSLWLQAKGAVLKGEHKDNELIIGAIPAVWESCLTDWIEPLYLQNKNLHINARMGSRSLLAPQLHERNLDLLIATTPSKMDEMTSQKIGEMSLTAFSFDKKINEKRKCYIDIEWSPEFSQREDIGDEYDEAVLSTSSAIMALQLLKNTGGCAYLPTHWQKKHSGIKVVSSLPNINLPIYAIWLQNGERESLIRDLIDRPLLAEYE
ncbi:HTH-type transcriptional regulator HdfR [Leminorella grimontii]|uniref:HTH-type transcriptional regulator HdfR n=1 Tax=Leminorella grimontii TaxID=82981 RepID=UPI0020878C0C|nr:HTH-type transcriptional regulator HdfR [Leminorella grimontii]GKX61115.1 HTH-type transcriptional regulator HdfR [Leminorella grimontii]